MNKNILNTVTWPHNTGIMMEYEYTFNVQHSTLNNFNVYLKILKRKSKIKRRTKRTKRKKK